MCRSSQLNMYQKQLNEVHSAVIGDPIPDESKLAFHENNLSSQSLCGPSCFFLSYIKILILDFLSPANIPILLLCHVILPAGILLFYGKILKQILPFPSYRKNFIMQPSRVSRRTYIIHGRINNVELMNSGFFLSVFHSIALQPSLSFAHSR